jgi:Flp pilus assembly protein TadB
MSAPHRHEEQPTSEQQETAKHGHSRWMMIACCVPMLVIALALVLTGVVGYGFLVVAVACTLMMAVMMGGKSHAGDGQSRR